MIHIGKYLQGDKSIWSVFFFLCAISLIEVFSALSSATYEEGSYIGPFLHHAFFVLSGMVITFLVHYIPCRWFKTVASAGMLVSILLLGLILLGFGVTLNGAARWINIGILIQPSEIAKGSLVLTTAVILSECQTPEGTSRRAMHYILVCSALICGLIAPGNLSTALFLFFVVFVMMFIGRVPLKQLGKLLGVLLILLTLAFSALSAISTEQAQWASRHLPLCGRIPTWKDRISGHSVSHAQEWKYRMAYNEEEENARREAAVPQTLEDSLLAPQNFDIDKKAQIGHACIAIASSNIIGKLPGNSVERDFLPLPFSDYIFAIIIEELGLTGALFVVFLYVVLLFRAGRIASRCEKSMPAFIVMGLALLLVFQALINMAVVVDTGVVTGQPLPLVSRGGTSFWINCVYIGMILSVSRYAKKKEAQNKRLPEEEQDEELPDSTEEYYSEEGMK